MQTVATAAILTTTTDQQYYVYINSICGSSGHLAFFSACSFMYIYKTKQRVTSEL